MSVLLMGGGKGVDGAAPAAQTTLWDFSKGSNAESPDATLSAMFSNGDRTFKGTGAGGPQITRVLNLAVSQAAKSYWEIAVDLASNPVAIGFSSGSIDAYFGNFGGATQSAGIATNGTLIGNFSANGGVSTPNILSPPFTGQVISCVYDGAAKKFAISADGVTWYGSGLVAADPVAGTHMADNTGQACPYPAVSYQFVDDPARVLFTINAGANIIRTPPTGYAVLS